MDLNQFFNPKEEEVQIEETTSDETSTTDSGGAQASQPVSQGSVLDTYKGLVALGVLPEQSYADSNGNPVTVDNVDALGAVLMSALIPEDYYALIDQGLSLSEYKENVLREIRSVPQEHIEGWLRSKGVLSEEEIKTKVADPAFFKQYQDTMLKERDAEEKAWQEKYLADIAKIYSKNNIPATQRKLVDSYLENNNKILQEKVIQLVSDPEKVIDLILYMEGKKVSPMVVKQLVGLKGQPTTRVAKEGKKGNNDTFKAVFT